MLWVRRLLMYLSKNSSSLLAFSNLNSLDYRVWFLLVENEFTPEEIASIFELKLSTVSRSRNNLLKHGWIDVVKRVGTTKTYTARTEQNTGPQVYFDYSYLNSKQSVF